jgi:hypothetical protein
MSATPVFPVDYDKLRRAMVVEVQKITGLTCIMEQPETQDTPRPANPYFSMLITGPAGKSGDDSKDNVLDDQGNPTTGWNSGGVRKMTVGFNAYGRTHEEAYSYMGLLQTSLDLQNVQEDLRRAGIAVWVIGAVADLSQLLNTGYEGRAHMEVQFGIAMNLSSDLGAIETAVVEGAVDTGSGTADVSANVTE